MHEVAQMRRRRRAWFMVVGLVLVGAGCGDDGSGAAELERRLLRPGSDGRAVWLERRSTRCGAQAHAPLFAFVGPGAEFAAAEVGALEPPCPGAPSPQIDIRVEDQSVLVDFSTVVVAGAFPHGDFEGYALHFARGCPDMALSSASVDDALSNVPLAPHDVRTHFDRLDINFEGIRYDPRSFIKIDLASVYVDCLRD